MRLHFSEDRLIILLLPLVLQPGRAVHEPISERSPAASAPLPPWVPPAPYVPPPHETAERYQKKKKKKKKTNSETFLSRRNPIFISIFGESDSSETLPATLPIYTTASPISFIINYSSLCHGFPKSNSSNLVVHSHKESTEEPQGEINIAHASSPPAAPAVSVKASEGLKKAVTVDATSFHHSSRLGAWAKPIKFISPNATVRLGGEEAVKLKRDGQGRQLKTSFKMGNSGQGHTFRYLPQAKRRGPYHGSVRRLHLLVPCLPP
ncbi:hypothetical protein Bca52824_002691 [Brassica carinata]|uniref:Uncharacterized protein n=1 Tax=Brassica carinata TaxID=52824 RepID=A0A8X7WKR2_BRACI|nr:hypothetical protein Bca52824_002691 [Brassica carinata]